MGAGPDLQRLSSGLWATVKSTWFLGVVLLLLTWPVGDLSPRGGLDNSFFGGLYLAARSGFHFGTDIVATYGPLGFLRTPVLFDTDLARLAVLYKATVQLGLCLTLLWSLRRTFPAPVAFLLVLVLAGEVISGDAALVIVFVWAVEMLRRDAHPSVRRLFPATAGVLAGVEVMVKLNTGATVVLLCLLACVGQDRGRRRSTATFLATFAVTALTCWFATGQGLSNVGHYLSTAQQVISGWSTVMMLVDPSAGWQLWAALLASVLVVYLALRASATAPMSARARGGICVLWIVLGFSVFKEGFVRQEPGHVAVYFATALGACAAFAWRPSLRTPIILSLAVVAVSFFGVTRTDPFDAVKSAPDRVRAAYHTAHAMVSSAERDRIVAEARVRLVATYQFPPRLAALLEGHTVQVLPAETTLVWLLRLRWRPMPVFEPYYAYTSELDNANANVLAGKHAPERTVRAPGPAVDDRSPQFDSPAAVRAMLCHYVSLGSAGSWQVIGRVPNRCGLPAPLRRVRARWGEPTQVPAPHDSSAAVFVRIHGVGVTGLERVVTMLYRARTRSIVLDGTQSYRLVPETAADGTVLSVPAGADYPAPFALAPNAKTIAVTKGHPGEPQPGGNVDYVFYELPLRSAGPEVVPRAR